MTDDSFYVKKIPQSVYRKRHQQEASPDKNINYQLKKLPIKSEKQKKEFRENIAQLYESVCKGLFSEESLAYISKDNYLEQVYKKLGL